jgi:hypothetical protein
MPVAWSCHAIHWILTRENNESPAKAGGPPRLSPKAAFPDRTEKHPGRCDTPWASRAHGPSLRCVFIVRDGREHLPKSHVGSCHMMTASPAEPGDFLTDYCQPRIAGAKRSPATIRNPPPAMLVPNIMTRF